ncbi:3-dehydroquinate synthase [Flavobacteriaceae bacterium UJ101]|nr:3-dehydroquinate synthase [Flavobacteriaceae bacterium UJ101]
MTKINCLDYSIYFGLESYSKLNDYLIANQTNISKVFILTDNNTNEYCLPILMANSVLSEVEIIEIEEGEINKNIETCVLLWDTLSELGADRNSLMINLGGGVITDMGGFVASTFKRGIRYINIPTTLLSQVDASVGGKTGIDLGHLKNQVGVFSYPEMILIDTQFLQTLEQRQLKSGLAEMLKHGLIQDKTHWETLNYAYKDLDYDQLENLIYDSVSIKKNVVESDPKEKGLRKILNFGHTIGHGIESSLLNTENQLLHGESIAIGMICEAYIAFKTTNLPEKEMKEIKSSLLAVFPKVDSSIFNLDSILNYMEHDKKNIEGEFKFSLLSKIGECEFNCPATMELIKESFEFYNL